MYQAVKGVGMERFTGSFTQQEPIPEAGIEAAIAVLRHGRLHRYNTAPGEIAETALLKNSPPIRGRNSALPWLRVAMPWDVPCAPWAWWRGSLS